MDTILRLLEGLRRDEIVWLNTYLTGRLRAMPPPAAAAATAQVSAGPAHADIAGDSVDELPAVRVVYSDCGCHLLRHALVCMTAYHLLVVIGLFTGGDGLSALGPFHLHVSPRCRRLFSVWLWVLVFVVGWCLLALVLLVLLCLFSRLCTIRSVIHKL